MTVKELIQVLESYPDDLRVVVSGYESGYDDVTPERISVINIQLNVGTANWEGQHERPDLLSKGTPRTGAVVEALAFHRASN